MFTEGADTVVLTQGVHRGCSHRVLTQGADTVVRWAGNSLHCQLRHLLTEDDNRCMTCCGFTLCDAGTEEAIHGGGHVGSATCW